MIGKEAAEDKLVKKVQAKRTGLNLQLGPRKRRDKQ